MSVKLSLSAKGENTMRIFKNELTGTHVGLRASNRREQKIA